MSTEPVNRRSYSSAKRTDQARTTRRRIRDAAQRLFLEHSYAGTSMRAIAETAEVSERTVYLAFPTKAALISELIVIAVRGDDGARPMLGRDDWQRVVDAPRDQVAPLLAAAVGSLWDRAAQLIAIGELAGESDPDLRILRDRGRNATRTDLTYVASRLKKRGLLRSGIGVERAGEALYAIAGNEKVYLRLVDECGWTNKQYERWLAQLIDASLLRGH